MTATDANDIASKQIALEIQDLLHESLTRL